MYLRFLGFPLSFAQKVASIVFFTPIAPFGSTTRLRYRLRQHIPFTRIRFEAPAVHRFPYPLRFPRFHGEKIDV